MKTPHHTDIPRATALKVLNRLNAEIHPHLDQLMTELVDESGLPFSHRDRRFINTLIYGVMRWRGRLDDIIRHYSRTPFDKIHPEIQNILRLGLYQIFFLDRVPDSAAVNTSVELAKQTAPDWIVKYVNGLLRNAVRKGLPPFPAPDQNPVAALCAAKSFPPWLIQRWLARFGRSACEALCDAANAIPPLTLRCNTLKMDRQRLMDALGPEVESVSPARHAPDGIRITNPQKPLHALSAFQNGGFQVQDEAAQLATRLLSPGRHETILDACAGLGGKTGYISQLMGNTGRIIAADRDADKLKALKTAVERLGVFNVRPEAHDFTKPPKNWTGPLVDRVFLDAPCSGLGVIRRNPDIKWDAGRKNLLRFQQKQIRLLDCLADLVRPGGMIVYAVCSFEPEENENVVDSFLADHRHFQTEPADLAFLPDPGFFWDKRGFFRTFPHVHDMDGFFAAILRRAT